MTDGSATGAEQRLRGYEFVGEIAPHVHRVVELESGESRVLKWLPHETEFARAEYEWYAGTVVSNRHLMRIYGATKVGGRCVLILEDIPGKRTLWDLVGHPRRETRRFVEFAVGLVVRVAGAAHELHERGFVHRDIKPSNILMGLLGRNPVLGDYGIVCVMDDRFTRRDQVLGTPGYMSPEYVRHGIVGRSADVFALGVTLYELVTGVKPFPEDDDDHRYPPPRNPSSLNPAVPPELSAICLRALAPSRRGRYADMAGFGQDLNAWLNGRPTSVGRGRLARFRESAAFVARVPAIRAAALPLAGAAIFVAAAWWSSDDTLAKRAAIGRQRAFDFLVMQSPVHGVPGGQTSLENLIARAADHRSTLETDDLDGVDLLLAFGSILSEYGALDEAEACFADARRAFRGLLGDDDPRTLAALSNLSVVELGRCQQQIDRGDGQLARVTATAALAGMDQARRGLVAQLDDDDPLVLRVDSGRALALLHVERVDDAFHLLTDLVDRCDRRLGKRHLLTADVRVNLAGACVVRGALDAAGAWIDEALDSLRAMEPPPPPPLARAMNVRAVIDERQGRPVDALHVLREAEELAERLPASHPVLRTIQRGIERLER